MWPILLISVFVIAVVVERTFYLFFRFNINARDFMAQIEKLVLANNVDRAIKLCNAAPAAVLSRVVKAALTRANKGETEILNAVEESVLEVVPQVEKRTGSLQAMASIATLLGLLGTIQGMIQAFAGVGLASPDQRAALLTQAIAVAMNTTFFGLVVAVPAMTAHLFLAGVTRRILDEMDHHAVKLQNLLISRARGSLLTPVEQRT